MVDLNPVWKAMEKVFGSEIMNGFPLLANVSGRGFYEDPHAKGRWDPDWNNCRQGKFTNGYVTFMADVPGSFYVTPPFNKTEAASKIPTAVFNNLPPSLNTPEKLGPGLFNYGISVKVKGLMELATALETTYPGLGGDAPEFSAFRENFRGILSNCPPPSGWVDFRARKVQEIIDWLKERGHGTITAA